MGGYGAGCCGIIHIFRALHWAEHWHHYRALNLSTKTEAVTYL
jgi:hypothetical protein